MHTFKPGTFLGIAVYASKTRNASECLAWGND